MRIVTIPNALTTARIVLVPVFITAVVYEEYPLALALFATAAVSDLLDGLVARLTDQKTPLGTFLDPLADKFLLISSFIVFTINGWIPKWLTITVISRDLIVVVGWLLLFMISGRSKVEPVLSGKIAIALQLITFAVILLKITTATFPDILNLFFAATAALTVLSGLQYIVRGLTASHEI